MGERQTEDLKVPGSIPGLGIFYGFAAIGMDKDVRKYFSLTLTLQMTPVGFEPTQLALVELESTPLDHSGKVSLYLGYP